MFNTMTSLESKQPAPDSVSGGSDDASVPHVVPDTSTSDTIATRPQILVPGEVEPAQPTSVGLWGPSGMGKTQFAATLLSDLGFGPALYLDLDGGLPALRGYEAADLIVHRPAKYIADVVAAIRAVGAGHVRNRAGLRVRSVIVDAVSCLVTAEIERLNMSADKPMEQAQKLQQPFKVLWGHLRSLHRDHGVTCVTVAHSKVRTIKINDVPFDFIVPDMFACIARPWMASVRHLWRIVKTRGAKGPAYPIVQLRTEVEGVYGAANYQEYMKTSNIAFAHWIAGESGKREHLQWDTGTLPVDQHPTLATLLRVAEDLAIEQGRVGATNPAALRALASLQAAMDAAATATAT